MLDVFLKCIVTNLVVIAFCCYISEAIDEAGGYEVLNLWIKTIGSVCIIALFPMVIAFVWVFNV